MDEANVVHPINWEPASQPVTRDLQETKRYIMSRVDG